MQYNGSIRDGLLNMMAQVPPTRVHAIIIQPPADVLAPTEDHLTHDEVPFKRCDGYLPGQNFNDNVSRLCVLLSKSEAGDVDFLDIDWEPFEHLLQAPQVQQPQQQQPPQQK